jgi:Holliday junction resolvase RusA-like endonuclease
MIMGSKVVLKLKILLPVPSWNAFIGTHHWKMTNEKKKWAHHVGMAKIFAKANGEMPYSMMLKNMKRLVTVIAYRKRRIDTDNLCLKPIMDALVIHDLLKDDSIKWCQLHVKQEKCEKGEAPFTIVELENME